MMTYSKTPALDDTQLFLFGDQPSATCATALRTAADTGRRFVTGDARSIFIGTTRLEDYLKHVGQKTPFVVERLLVKQNWSTFEQRYAATGRAPYAPSLMMGLILYGVMQGVHTLRQLEQLARLDLGCMWVTGGIRPDHAIIGRFITLHHDSLTGEFFESLTRAILKESGSDSSRLAGDGTVIEAACSHYNRLKEEAVREMAAAAAQALKDAPDDQAAQKKQQDTAQCLDIFEKRIASRERSGRKTDTLTISGSEPEAMVQPAKRGRGVAASYKPSALANKDRIITGFAVDPSSENKVVGAMLDQSERTTGVKPTEVLLDAGYFDDGVIEETLSRDISMLCPEGQLPGTLKAGKHFTKSQFVYDEQTKTYRCPAGQIMIKLKSNAGLGKTKACDLYGGANCADCHLRTACTSAEGGRTINRHPEDERRDALRSVMQQPQVKKIFRQRQAMIEPIFSRLRGQQGLNRFHRSGLKAVTREFALHAMAHNLSRAVALLGAIFIVLNAFLAHSGKGGEQFWRRCAELVGASLNLLYFTYEDKLKVYLMSLKSRSATASYARTTTGVVWFFRYLGS
jgi:transposase